MKTALLIALASVAFVGAAGCSSSGTRCNPRVVVPKPDGITISGVIRASTTKETLAGVTVRLYCSCLTGPLVTETAENGVYRFDGLVPGTYTVVVLQPDQDHWKQEKWMTLDSKGTAFRANFQMTSWDTYEPHDDWKARLDNRGADPWSWGRSGRPACSTSTPPELPWRLASVTVETIRYSATAGSRRLPPGLHR